MLFSFIDITVQQIIWWCDIRIIINGGFLDVSVGSMKWCLFCIFSVLLHGEIRSWRFGSTKSIKWQ